MEGPGPSGPGWGACWGPGWGACWLLLLLILISALPGSHEQDEVIPHIEVKNWALKLGVTLWAYGQETTKMNEIQRKYRDKEVKVTRKDGLMLIRDMAVELKNMMDSKMHAVLRIMDSAEQAALSHKMDILDGFATVFGGREPPMRSSRHFDQIPVNTNFSAVLMARDVDEKDPDVQNGIMWSELLDPLFINNYETDPTLSWQYFGSSSGFFRRYPATRSSNDEYNWGSVSKGTVHDFRTSQWYVSAATSPKDLVILVGAASSLSSARRELALSTARVILETLGDNDFVNVYRFSDTPTEIVPCFKDMLVQATASNVRELRSALNALRPEGSSNTTAALVTAFELLHKYNRTGQGSQCNQAIMLITDGPVLPAYKEVLKHYNSPHMPVRMFTYLVGKDSTTATELNRIACGNKGFFTRITNKKDIRSKVLQYVSVMSRPLVMYQNEHPVQWTSVYRGGKGSSLLQHEAHYGQLMTSVSAPVFDRRNHSERVANLLGVVGTDIPVEQIMKLVQPYKLGVNGYSFVVDNNGHVLYHPDLRPLPNKEQFQDSLKPEYNSVDLTEVELVDSDGGPRENNSMLLDLRHDMIEQKEGETEITIKVNYQGMRVTSRRNKYFYNPIDGTPFSLALALPEGYGMYETIGEEEIKRSSVNLTDCFKGENWKVHPDWVYCEYNYATDHHFKTPEDQLMHFLNRVRKPGWKWMSQRHWAPQSGFMQTMKKLERDSYFCDKSLVQSLVYDAIVTGSLDRPRNMDRVSSNKEDRHQGYQFFGATLSFIATRSGLLRWQKLEGGSSGEEQGRRFSEANRRAIDEVWYKRAVEQHKVEPESFVYSVPFEGGAAGQLQVTATHAVFVEHKGHRAPAAVVGVQYQQSTLASHFINITSTCAAKCNKTCASESLDCYVLDNNGFIILSERSEDAGKFFGQVDGTIMDSLVQDRIYKRVVVYDYQAACTDEDSPYSAAPASARVPALSSMFRLLGEMVTSYVAAVAAHLQLRALLSDTWCAAARVLRDYPSFADDEDSTGEIEDEEDGLEEEDGEEEDESDDGQEDNMDRYNGGSGRTDVSNTVELVNPGYTNIRNDWDTSGRERDSTDLEESESGWQVYRRLEPQPPAPSPAPPPQEEDFEEDRDDVLDEVLPPPPQPAPPPPPPALNLSRARPCDKRVDLYVLQPDKLNTSGASNPLKGKLTNCHATGCERPFSVQKIPYSNLILLVVDTLCPCGNKQLGIHPQEVTYDSAPACKGRNPRDNLLRRRPPKCISYHPEEIEIHACGSARAWTASWSTVMVLAALVVRWRPS